MLSRRFSSREKEGEESLSGLPKILVVITGATNKKNPCPYGHAAPKKQNAPRESPPGVTVGVGRLSVRLEPLGRLSPARSANRTLRKVEVGEGYGGNPPARARSVTGQGLPRPERTQFFCSCVGERSNLGPNLRPIVLSDQV